MFCVPHPSKLTSRPLLLYRSTNTSTTSDVHSQHFNSNICTSSSFHFQNRLVTAVFVHLRETINHFYFASLHVALPDLLDWFQPLSAYQTGHSRSSEMRLRKKCNKMETDSKGDLNEDKRHAGTKLKSYFLPSASLLSYFCLVEPSYSLHKDLYFCFCYPCVQTQSQYK